MGGGGIMRTAARAAIGSAYRPSATLDHIAAVGARRAAKPSPSTAAPPAVEPLAPPSPLMSSTSHNAQLGMAVPQPPVWELDDWVFANGLEDELLDELEFPTRIVFGPVPTLEEAKEATSDLKDAIEKIYFSSPDSEGVPERTYLPTQPSNSSSSQTIVCTSVGSAALIPPASHSVMQAFSLLQQSPEVQNVVASLASDEKVWDAVMKNEKVVEFYKSHQNSFHTENLSTTKDINQSAESILDYFHEKPAEKSVDCENGLVQFINALKLKVSQMVMNVTSLIQDFLGSASSNPGDANNPTSESNMNSYLLGSFFALAVAAIMVVLLKRA